MTLLKQKGRPGFTLVELLVVVSLIGILAGVAISILNPVKQRKVAEDGVKQSNLQKYALGIEAYANAGSSYPTSITFVNNIPTVPADLVNFLARRPNGEPIGATYDYYYSAGDDSFSISVIKSESANSCYKYRSNWGKIKTCPLAQCGAGDSALCI
ncbi:prepilin-type N-terminal cleavage/methylation domain-containing protein [Patescibacteria group bacterium]|nr:prepilin-type N-terminal cleavage/methylation domain-containing protein [Patescibacteria group bacterium]MBU1970572.1 prepilin-type N-terminal cleavage/methylation domain-containing protein [Patescibacteria group bacterium]